MQKLLAYLVMTSVEVLCLKAKPQHRCRESPAIRTAAAPAAFRLSDDHRVGLLSADFKFLMEVCMYTDEIHMFVCKGMVMLTF